MPARKKVDPEVEGAEEQPEVEETKAGKVLAYTVYVGDDVYPAGTVETAELRDVISADHVWVDGE